MARATTRSQKPAGGSQARPSQPGRSQKRRVEEEEEEQEEEEEDEGRNMDVDDDEEDGRDGKSVGYATSRRKVILTFCFIGTRPCGVRARPAGHVY